MTILHKCVVTNITCEWLSIFKWMIFVCSNDHLIGMFMNSHNKGFLMQKYPFISARDFSFILCKYLHFICLVENLWTSLRKIYGQGVSLENLCINLRQINENFRPGINGYFCIKKILHFNGNGHFKEMCWHIYQM